VEIIFAFLGLLIICQTSFLYIESNSSLIDFLQFSLSFDFIADLKDFGPFIEDKANSE
jgi:hypothetical protein